MLLNLPLRRSEYVVDPISARRQLNDLSDEMAMKISILFFADGREALIKALGD
jgi:ATP-dependent Lon protease